MQEEIENEINILHQEISQAKNQITPKNYQLNVLEHALQYNTIAFMDTGTGKNKKGKLLLQYS